MERKPQVTKVKIQKNFKVTPHYMDIEEYNADTGYHMGVYLCLGQQIHNVEPNDALDFCTMFKNFQSIHSYMENHESILVFLSEGTHKIKRKAEQIACEKALRFMDEE